MFWKKRKYKLPKFPPHSARIFKQLCINIEDSELETLQKAMNRHFDDNIAQNTGSTNLDYNDAINIKQVCNFLLHVYPQYPDEKRKLIIGAVRYAASDDDPFCDSTFSSGLEDDKKILNYVLEELEIEGHYLDIY